MLLWHAEGTSRKKIRNIDWPATDLSPIENPWAIIRYLTRLMKSLQLISMIEDIF